MYVKLALQSRAPQHGLGRHHPKAAAGHGRIALLLVAPKNGGITTGVGSGNGRKRPGRGPREQRPRRGRQQGRRAFREDRVVARRTKDHTDF